MSELDGVGEILFGKYMSEIVPDVGTAASKFGHMEVGRGIRGILYMLSFFTLFFCATVVYALVYFQYLPPDPTDDFCGLLAFLSLWLPIWAFIGDTSRTKIQKLEEFVFMWILTSGLAQVGWELPFVLWKKDYLHSLRSTETLDPDELWAWPFWLYGSGDTRYMREHSASHATETMLAISGFFELAAVYFLYRRRRYKTAMIIAALTHWGFFWANTSVMYLLKNQFGTDFFFFFLISFFFLQA